MTPLYVEYGDFSGRLSFVYVQGEPNKDIQTLIREQMPDVYNEIKEIYDVTIMDEML